MDESGRGGENERLVELEQRVEQLEARRSPAERSRSAMNSMVPSETRQHLRAAGREQLLAVRSLLDYWIARLRDEPDKPDKTRENIKID